MASAAGTSELQADILRGSDLDNNLENDSSAEETLAIWTTRYGGPWPEGSDASKQRHGDAAAINADKNMLWSTETDRYSRARLLATSAPHSSDWLYALPISSCGLRLNNEAVRVAVGLRLGVPICEPHTCPCGSLVDARGSHCLACRRSAGRMARHQQINELIYRALNRAKVPSVKEPTGLTRLDGKRPDGLTLIPWRSGRCLTWDVTIADTFTYIQKTSLAQGGAADIAAARKIEKYTDLARTYEFCPIAMETLGPINEIGLSFLYDLGRRLVETTGDTRETTFLLQRISIAIQRCNAVSFRGSFTEIADAST